MPHVSLAPFSRRVLDRRLDALERRVDVLASTFSDPELQRRFETLRRSLAAASTTLHRATPTQCATVASLLDDIEGSLSRLVTGSPAAQPGSRP
jgi:hypothetical protein